MTARSFYPWRMSTSHDRPPKHRGRTDALFDPVRGPWREPMIYKIYNIYLFDVRNLIIT